jgi:hypothetical protein
MLRAWAFLSSALLVLGVLAVVSNPRGAGEFYGGTARSGIDSVIELFEGASDGASRS